MHAHARMHTQTHTHNIHCICTHMHRNIVCTHRNSRGLLSTWGGLSHLSHEITKKATSELKNRQVRVCVCVRMCVLTCISVFRPHIVTQDFMWCTEIFGQCDKPSDNQLSSCVHTDELSRHVPHEYILYKQGSFICFCQDILFKSNNSSVGLILF